MKSPVNGHRHPLVLKLAACLPVADPRSAVEHAYLVRDLLYAWSVEQSPRTGLVEDVGSRALSMLVGWRGDPDAFLGDLRRVGLVDRYGRLVDWNFITGAVSPQHEAQLQDRFRQRKWRQEHDQPALGALDGTRPDHTPDRDTGVTGHVTDLAALEERVPDARSETDSSSSLSGAARPMPLAKGATTTKASATRRLRSQAVTTVPPIPALSVDEVLASLPEAARLVADQLKFIPDPVAADAIAAEVGDDPDDLDTWDATLGKWATATKTGGGAYHRGPNALPALLERFRANRQARRDKLDAVLRKATERNAVTGDVAQAPAQKRRRLSIVEAVAEVTERVDVTGIVDVVDVIDPAWPAWFVAWRGAVRSTATAGLWALARAFRPDPSGTFQIIVPGTFVLAQVRKEAYLAVLRSAGDAAGIAIDAATFQCADGAGRTDVAARVATRPGSSERLITEAMLAGDPKDAVRALCNAAPKE